MTEEQRNRHSVVSEPQQKVVIDKMRASGLFSLSFSAAFMWSLADTSAKVFISVLLLSWHRLRLVEERSYAPDPEERRWFRSIYYRVITLESNGEYYK